MIIFIAWFYYSKLYILGSLFVTLLLNRTTDKLYLPPLIINMVSVILLFLSTGDRTYALYFNYMPVVTTSIILNLSIYIYRKLH
ncbi:hypothetical protein [Caviibacter abscessus]|uniref:hypothetical protein n=1 Tax=Caviibacter abscessus TaxID=1766719 RepID=UPI000829C9CB|nr:hypothetical protein [Caviibacter abscessus]